MTRSIVTLSRPCQTVLQLSLAGIPLALFMLAAWWHRHINDDGFIYLRIVSQITQGNGPVFNAGERVEAFTGPLWLGLLTLVEITLPWRLEWLVIGLSLVCTGTGLILAIAGSRTLVRIYAPGALLVPFGLLVPLSIGAAWAFSTSGLELPLVVAWLGGCLFVLARWAASDQRLPLYGAVIIGLGWLVRPELALHSALFVGAVVLMQWPRESWGQRLQTLLAATALPIGYQIFRMGYYGAVIANSAIAKDAATTNWSQGWSYLIEFTGVYWLWIALFVVLIGGYLPAISAFWRTRHHRAIVVCAAFILAGLANAAYIIANGGDWMHGRLLLPPLYTLVMPVAVVALVLRHSAAALLLPWVLACALILSPQFVSEWSGGWQRVTLEQRHWGEEGPRLRQLEEHGFYYDRAFAMHFVRIELDAVSDRITLPAAAVGGLGASSYALGPEWHIIDFWGLAHPLTARLISTPGLHGMPRLPGHEKPLPNVWLAALIAPEGAVPDADAFPKRGDPLIPFTSGEQFQRQVAFAHAALQCPALRELFDAISTPLDMERFLRNLGGAWRRTWLAIPPDPEQAYQQLCPAPDSGQKNSPSILD